VALKPFLDVSERDRVLPVPAFDFERRVPVEWRETIWRLDDRRIGGGANSSRMRRRVEALVDRQG
jgi:hypothetical protein